MLLGNMENISTKARENLMQMQCTPQILFAAELYKEISE